MQNFTICSPNCQAKSVEALSLPQGEREKRKSGPLALGRERWEQTPPSFATQSPGAYRASRGGMEAPCAAITVWQSRPRLGLVEERRFSAAKKDDREPTSLRRRAWEPRRASRGGMEAPCAAIPGCDWWKSGALAPREVAKRIPIHAPQARAQGSGAR